MAKARTRLAEGWTYVLLADQTLDLSERSVFHLMPLAQADRVAVLDNLARTRTMPDGSAVTQTRRRQEALGICLTHIAQIDNFPVGAPKAWPVDEAARALYLEQLDDDAISEIGEEIFTRSTIGRVEKNSSPPEPTPSSGENSATSGSTTVASAPSTPP